MARTSPLLGAGRLVARRRRSRGTAAPCRHRRRRCRAGSPRRAGSCRSQAGPSAGRDRPAPCPPRRRASAGVPSVVHRTVATSSRHRRRGVGVRGAGPSLRMTDRPCSSWPVTTRRTGRQRAARRPTEASRRPSASSIGHVRTPPPASKRVDPGSGHQGYSRARAEAVAQHPDAVDLELDDVAGRQVPAELERRAVADGARADDVARLKPVADRDVGDELGGASRSFPRSRRSPTPHR